jgi:hypothetical protein
MNSPASAPPTTRRGRSCWFYGCLVSAILLVLVLVGGFLTVRYVAGKLSNAVRQYTDAQPASLPRNEMSPSEQKALDARLAAFTSALDGTNAAPVLALSGSEINALINQNALFKDKVFVTVEGDRVQGQISLPLEDLQLPVVGGLVKGRYFNGAAAFRVSLRDGILVVSLASLEIGGKPVPPEVMAPLSEQNLAEGVQRDPQQAQVLRKLESIEIKDGRLVIRPKSAPKL